MKKDKQEKSNFDEVFGMFGNSDEQFEVTDMDRQNTFTDIKDDTENDEDDASQ
jgi:hypothetical protein